jgi:hypothetical protein
MTIRAGFSNIVVNAALPEGKAFHEDIEVNAMWLGGSGAECCWCAMDFMDFDRPSVECVRASVSETLGLRPENIHILTTHNHGAPPPEELNIDLLARKTAICVSAAKERSAPAFIRYGETEAPSQINCLRRLYLEELDGSVTFFFGPCQENNYDSGPSLRNFIFQLKENHEAVYAGACAEAEKAALNIRPERLRLPAADARIQTLLFERGDGAALGTVCRFAAHAVCCNSPDYYSSDFPFYVRKTLRDRLGGGAIFLNGPCAEIAPGVPDKKSGFEKKLGALIGGSAVKSLGGSEPERLVSVKDLSLDVSLPLRAEMRLEKEDAKSEISKIQNLMRANGGSTPLPELKRLAERVRLLRTLGFLKQKARGENSAEKHLTVRLGKLELNNITLLAFPGETFSSTAIEIERACPGRKIITVTEHERTAMYIVPANEIHRGGYESGCGMTTADAERILRDSTMKLLARSAT